jgi:hypothetical protein
LLETKRSIVNRGRRVMEENKIEKELREESKNIIEEA